MGCGTSVISGEYQSSTRSMTLEYHNRAKPITLQTDYSEDALEVTLVQEGKTVRFASKSLSDNEVDYNPI